MDPFSQLPKKNKLGEEERALDPFVQLPTEIIQNILSFRSTKNSGQAVILSKTFLKACSTNPNLRLSDFSFSNVLRTTYEGMVHNISQNQEAQKAKEMFASYVDHTLTRYQEHDLPVKRLYLRSRVDDDKTARFLEQFIGRAKDRVKEFHLRILYFPFSNSSTSLLQAIFALKDQLQILELFRCDLTKDVIQDDGIIKFSSLAVLKLTLVFLDEGVLQKLIHCCPLLKELEIYYCEGLEIIQVANLPSLKWLHVGTDNNQMVDVKAANLEIMIYEANTSSPYLLNIESTRNLKELSLICLNITDEQLHNLIAKCPILKKLSLEECNEIQKINLSSQSLSFVSLNSCTRLLEVKIDAPSPIKFEWVNTPTRHASFQQPGVVL